MIVWVQWTYRLLSSTILLALHLLMQWWVQHLWQWWRFTDCIRRYLMWLLLWWLHWHATTDCWYCARIHRPIIFPFILILKFHNKEKNKIRINQLRQTFIMHVKCSNRKTTKGHFNQTNEQSFEQKNNELESIGLVLRIKVQLDIFISFIIWYKRMNGGHFRHAIDSLGFH